MIIIDMVGHSMNSESQCMFQITKRNYTIEYQPLHMYWGVLFVLSVLSGIGPLLDNNINHIQKAALFCFINRT